MSRLDKLATFMRRFSRNPGNFCLLDPQGNVHVSIGVGLTINSQYIVTNFILIKRTRCTNFSNLFWNETLHVSDSSSVHHQELFTVHSAVVYVIQVCRQLSIYFEGYVVGRLLLFAHFVILYCRFGFLQLYFDVSLLMFPLPVSTAVYKPV
jgi:hypothetical protein